MSQPLESRPGFRSKMDGLSKAVCELRERRGLCGVVMIDFTRERYGVCSSGDGPVWNAAMNELADKLFKLLDDGKLDPSPEVTK